MPQPQMWRRSLSLARDEHLLSTRTRAKGARAPNLPTREMQLFRLQLRPWSYHQHIKFFIGKRSPDFFRDERHEGMQESNGGTEQFQECPLCGFEIHRVAVFFEAWFCLFDNFVCQGVPGVV